MQCPELPDSCAHALVGTGVAMHFRLVSWSTMVECTLGLYKVLEYVPVFSHGLLKAILGLKHLKVSSLPVARAMLYWAHATPMPRVCNKST